MILTAVPDDKPSALWFRLRDQLGETEDPEEQDTILPEMDEIGYPMEEQCISERRRRPTE